MKKDLNETEAKRVALQTALSVKDKLIQAKEAEIKDLLAFKANLTQLKQNFDKTLEAKNLAFKKLDEEVAKLNAEVVQAKADGVAARGQDGGGRQVAKPRFSATA